MPNTEYTFATRDDLRKLNEARRRNNGYHWSRTSYPVAAKDTPFGDNDHLGEKLGFPDSVKVRGCHITANHHNHYYTWDYQKPYGQPTKEAEKLPLYPFFILINRKNDDKSGFRTTEKLTELAKTVKEMHFLGERGYYYERYYIEDLGDANLAAVVVIEGKEVMVVMPWETAESFLGLEITDQMRLRSSNGVECAFNGYKEILTNCEAYDRSYRNRVNEFDFTFTTLDAVKQKIGLGYHNMNRMMKGLLNVGWKITDIKMSGISKTHKLVEPLLDEVMKADPIAYCSYRTFAGNSARSVEGVKISSVFNEVFANVKTKDDFLTALKGFYCDKDTDTLYNTRNSLEEAIKRLDTWKEKRKAVIKSHANRAFTKLMEDAESLTIDRKKYKRTWKEIEEGNLPLGTFFRKSEQYFLLNDNWDLWEEMFKRGYRDQALELANEVKGRSTYEKDLMSYFYFVLHGLPEYLKKQTGHKWTCSPKLVNDADELEPPKEGDDGIARKRSALTPIVDNDKHHVVVPYASLAIYGGFGTTYCYSHDYHVLTKGYSLNGYAITNEVEKGLNGRDDYGLMFYTLTGSAQGRGYPTFLIIFERRSQKGDTKVHFHRTHPSRSKDGDYNPIHNWIRVCYNWMAGNIKSDRIKAQQGDLFFVQVKTEDSGEELEGAAVKNLKFETKVNQYDKHCFEGEVPFAEYTKAAKSNILGYVQLDKDTWLRHPEHDDVKIPAGTYAIHQCRSWEANPKGVWSLRID